MPFSLSIRVVLVALGVALLAGCGGGGTSTVPDNVDAAHTITVAPNGLFAPFILVVDANATVKWANQDSVTHAIKTTPDTLSFLNPEVLNLLAPAGGKALFTFTKPGIYHYYDDSQATWNDTDNRVSANSLTTYPLAMEGIVWVRGALRGIPATVTNLLGAQSDEYADEFVAITTGGTVTWKNPNTNTQAIDVVTGWKPPINPAATISQMTLKGTTDAPPNGASKTLKFTTPGLYYYYCALRASIDPTSHRAEAHDETTGGSSEYPIAMEGFVLVVG